MAYLLMTLRFKLVGILVQKFVVSPLSQLGHCLIKYGIALFWITTRKLANSVCYRASPPDMTISHHSKYSANRQWAASVPRFYVFNFCLIFDSFYYALLMTLDMYDAVFKSWSLSEAPSIKYLSTSAILIAILAFMRLFTSASPPTRSSNCKERLSHVAGPHSHTSIALRRQNEV